VTFLRRAPSAREDLRYAGLPRRGRPVFSPRRRARVDGTGGPLAYGVPDARPAISPFLSRKYRIYSLFLAFFLFNGMM